MSLSARSSRSCTTIAAIHSRYGQEKCATLLPRADAVVIFRGESQPLLARRWDDIAAARGPSMAAEDFYPPRFFVGSGPTDEQMAALEANSAHPEWMPRGK
jgi:hypothetical protein